MKFFSLILFLLFCFSSCKKKEIITKTLVDCDAEIHDLPSQDTVLPSDYFPAYPGSYWTLVNNTTNYSDTIKISITDWQKKTVYFPLSFEACGTFNAKTSIIPKIPYLPFSLWGDEIVVDAMAKKYASTLVKAFGGMNETTRIDKYPQTNSTDDAYLIIKSEVYDNFTVANVNYQDVLIISYERYYYAGKYGVQPSLRMRYYFAKDIGLILVSENLPFMKDYKLINHHIAPH